MGCLWVQSGLNSLSESLKLNKMGEKFCVRNVDILNEMVRTLLWTLKALGLSRLSLKPPNPTLTKN